MTDAERGRTLAIGNHQAFFLPPDVVLFRWNGVATSDDFEATIQWSEAQMPDGRRYFVVADMTNLEGVTPDARKAAVADPRAQRVVGFAVIGARFHIRVLIGMFMKALGFFYGERMVPMGFFAREDEALAWVEAQRASRSGKERGS